MQMQHCNHADQVKLPDVANISYKLLSYTVTWCVIAHACVGVSAYVCVCVFVLLCTLYEGRKICSSVSDLISLNQFKFEEMCKQKQQSAHVVTENRVTYFFIHFILFYFISSCKKNIHTDDFKQKFMFNFWSFSWIKVIHFHIEHY